MTIQDQQGQHHLHQFLIGTGANDGAGTGDVPVADCVSDIGLADPKTGSSSSALRISFMTQTFPGDSKIDFEVGSESLDDGTVDRRSDPCGPYQVTGRVKLTVQKWGATAAIPPDKFLYRILSSRGYSTEAIEAMSFPKCQRPTMKQISDYDSELVGAVRLSDLTKLKALSEGGKCMTACNKFGESIVHMACRRADFDIVDYLLNIIDEVWVVDDFGRTPLHDACWRPEPRFDIVTCLLDRDLNLIRSTDVRGANPLNYVREEHWVQWCAYLFHQKDKYWHPDSLKRDAV